MIKINSSKCTGCHSCTMVCSFSHTGEFNPRRARIGIANDHLRGQSTVSICRLCAQPACVKGCQFRVIKRSSAGNIEINFDLCVKCYDCIQTCPYHAIFVDPVSELPLVCDGCGGKPVCIDFCFNKALENSSGRKSQRTNAESCETRSP